MESGLRFFERSWGGLLLAGIFLICLLFENQSPLREVTQARFRRILVNLSIAAVSVGIVRTLFYPSVLRCSRFVAVHRWGLLSFGTLPPAIRVGLGFLVLDYTLYFWHWMNHEFPFLWRFHNVHHVDLDMDVSTASRFHFGEIVLSEAYRLGQIVVFGIDPVTLVFFDTIVLVATQFHHSNIRLPEAFEKLLNRIVVTPRMHTVHHSIVQGETNSNFSTIFSFWDRLHRSFRTNVPASTVTIGVPSYRDPRELTFLRSLSLPFRTQRAWRLPDGSYPTR